MLNSIIFSSAILIFVYAVLWFTGIFAEAELKEKIFGIVCLFIFAYCVYILIKRYTNVKSWKMEYCNYGNVIDKFKIPTSNRREYYIVAEVNGNKLKIKAANEYFRLNTDDDVIVFSIEGHNQVYITKND